MLKSKRGISFFVIAIVYTVAIFVGILVFDKFPFEPWLSLLLSDVLATVIVFVASVVFDNASVYDPYWSIQPIVILWAFAFKYGVNLTGLLFVAVVTLWGIRLTANWAYTFAGLSHQDWRYTMLKQRTGWFYPFVNFLGIHLVPTLIVYACVLPAVVVLLESAPFNVWSLPFLSLSAFAFILQGIADCQMHSFRKSKTGGFIRVGLWRHCRHPNYLGEILMWWGIAGASVCVLSDAWYLIVGALLNTVLFFTVSIPMAEKRQSRKEGFAEYKKQTRLLLPIKKIKE